MWASAWSGFLQAAAGELLAEWFVRTVRVELTDRMLIFNERRLRVVLANYVRHYNGRRSHRARDLCPPRPTYPVADLNAERITRRPVLGGVTLLCFVKWRGGVSGFVGVRWGSAGCRVVCGAVSPRSRAPSASLKRCRCAAHWTCEPPQPLVGGVAGRPRARPFITRGAPADPYLVWVDAGTMVIVAGRGDTVGLSGLGGGGHRGGEGVVELAGDVVLEAASDLA
jgi:hypothetical protein